MPPPCPMRINGNDRIGRVLSGKTFSEDPGPFGSAQPSPRIAKNRNTYDEALQSAQRSAGSCRKGPTASTKGSTRETTDHEWNLIKS